MIYEKDWLTPEELYEEFGFSISTQAKYRQKKKIPHSKIGRYIRYNRKKINDWLLQNEVEVR